MAGDCPNSKSSYPSRAKATKHHQRPANCGPEPSYHRRSRGIIAGESLQSDSQKPLTGISLIDSDSESESEVDRESSIIYNSDDDHSSADASIGEARIQYLSRRLPVSSNRRTIPPEKRISDSYAFRSRNTLKNVNRGLENGKSVRQTVHGINNDNNRRDNTKSLEAGKLLEPVLPSTDEIGLQWRISELRVALQASESARQEVEQEKQSLQNYLGEVEAVACRLHSQVRQLQSVVALLSANKSLDKTLIEVMGKASAETQSQAVIATQAIVSARNATMESDKVKRHASAIMKAQQDEIERLVQEAAQTRILYNARCLQLNQLKENANNKATNVPRQPIYVAELEEVKALLGGEKDHLLSQLALLHSNNVPVQDELTNWKTNFQDQVLKV